ncbi:hypothetical protein Tco_0586198 [Tanacetum coccineum]
MAVSYYGGQSARSTTRGTRMPLVIPEITAENNLFQQKFDETFYEAWDRFNDLLRGCPHHGFSELHQLDTFYNALNSIDQDSLNSAAGGNFLNKMPRECLKIIESKSKERITKKRTKNKAKTTKPDSGMEKTVKDKANLKPEKVNQSQKVNREKSTDQSQSQPKSTPRPKVKKYKFRD